MNTTCKACQRVAHFGIKCNHHRTESCVDRLIREATQAGHALTGSPVEQALQAERALGARPVFIN